MILRQAFWFVSARPGHDLIWVGQHSVNNLFQSEGFRKVEKISSTSRGKSTKVLCSYKIKSCFILKKSFKLLNSCHSTYFLLNLTEIIYIYIYISPSNKKQRKKLLLLNGIELLLRSHQCFYTSITWYKDKNDDFLTLQNKSSTWLKAIQYCLQFNIQLQ